ncbi:MAG: nitrate reductase molybdenum cofactor assembly chaperone [Blastochloris sp.]|nr:nitrate reductase molybdenum cofactor assembly chaperone [Blastochloris sp.]
MFEDTYTTIYRYLGDILDYPDATIAYQARACAALLQPILPESADQLTAFADFADETPIGRVEEIYTATFDINPTTYIFAGFILFGESFKRGKFLVKLQQIYRECGFETSSELADHAAVMLRFLAVCDLESTTNQELIDECLLPVLRHMCADFAQDTTHIHPYANVLQAVLNVCESVRTHEPVLETSCDERSMA